MLRIVDADPKVLRSAPRRQRSRSPEVLRLIKLLDELPPGQAKALVPEGDETVARLSVRLTTARKVSGVKLRVIKQPDRILFALKVRTGALIRAQAAERRQLVTDIALQLARRRKTITAEGVVKALDAAGTPVTGARPATAVGAILRRMTEFSRIAKNEFRVKA